MQCDIDTTIGRTHISVDAVDGCQSQGTASVHVAECGPGWAGPVFARQRFDLFLVGGAFVKASLMSHL